MIDIHSEQLVALRDVPALLPRRRNRRVHLSTVYRWVTRGAGGRVLESVRLGGVSYTSREALERFAAPAPDPPSSSQPPVGSRAARVEAAEKAAAEEFRI